MAVCILTFCIYYPFIFVLSFFHFKRQIMLLLLAGEQKITFVEIVAVSEVELYGNMGKFFGSHQFAPQ